MNQIQIKVNIDFDCHHQTKAFDNLIAVIKKYGGTSEKPKEDKSSIEKAKAIEEDSPAAETATIETKTTEAVENAESAEVENVVDIEKLRDEVRKGISNKVESHRDDIKEKLKEVGAENVSTIPEEELQSVLDFLNNLD